MSAPPSRPSMTEITPGSLVRTSSAMCGTSGERRVGGDHDTDELPVGARAARGMTHCDSNSHARDRHDVPGHGDPGAEIRRWLQLLPYGRSGWWALISMRRLYLATRSPRAGAPVLSWPHPVPTARSAMNGSGVSPERWETICAYPARWQMAMASRVSVTVPIWFSLIRAALPMPSAMAVVMMAGLVQKLSSPTS